MSYAKKTCNMCGFRDIQPNMYRVEKEVYVGSGNTGLSGRTWIGAAFGYKRSQRQIGKYFLAPNKRNYKRRREVWMCADCAGASTFGGSNSLNLTEEQQGLIAFCVLVTLIVGGFSLLTDTNFFDNMGATIMFFVNLLTGIFNFMQAIVDGIFGTT